MDWIGAILAGGIVLVLACVLVFFLSCFVYIVVAEGEHDGFFKGLFDMLMMLICSISSVVVFLVLKLAFVMAWWLAILLSIGAAIILAFVTKMIVSIWENIT